MNHLKKSQYAAITDLHNKAEKKLAALKHPTKESVEKVFNELALPNADQITLFTGYYSMSAASGAFLSIDTSIYYYKLSPKVTVSASSVSVSVSMDGKTSNTYQLDQQSTFDGKTLTIPGVLSITFNRQYNNGVLVTFTGTVNNVNVTGATEFNPIGLSVFNGSYYIPASPDKILVVNEAGSALGNSTVAYNFGSGLQELRLYTYVPLMFVLTFNEPRSGKNYLVMMGTASGRGLACFIQQLGEFGFTIPTV